MKNRVKELRTMQQLNAKQFADMVGITSQSLSNIEKGEQLPNVKTALKLARLLNVSVSYLYYQ